MRGARADLREDQEANRGADRRDAPAASPILDDVVEVVAREEAEPEEEGRHPQALPGSREEKPGDARKDRHQREGAQETYKSSLHF